MKRKIALLLAAVMTVAMLPMNAMADSSASLSRTGLTFQSDKVVVRGADVDVVESGYGAFTDSDSVTPITLDIRPTSGEIETDETIIIRVDNGKFDESLKDKNKYYYKVEQRTETYDNLYNEIKPSPSVIPSDDSIKNALNRTVHAATSNSMPWKIVNINEEEMEVALFPLPSQYVNQSSSDVAIGYPTYKIALPLTTEDSDEGDLTISVDGNGTAISDVNDRKVATVTDSDGSTTASVVQSQVKTYSDDTIPVPNITIREDLAGTFDEQEIEIRVNGNYDIDTTGVIARTGVNSKVSGTFAVGNGKNDRTLKIYLSQFTLGAGQPAGNYNCKGKTTTDDKGNPVEHSPIFDTTNLSTIVVEGIKVTAKDDDTYGDINITISGDTGISTQTITVAHREDYGFKLEALEEPTLIYSGRSPFPEDTKDSDVDDFVTAEFEFGETSPAAWLSGRKLEFSVPEGVKIIGYDITKDRYFDDTSVFYGGAKIVDDGTTLRFESSSDLFPSRRTNAAYIDLKLYLVSSINFTGDCAVSVSGAGLDADTLSDLVVAKFVSPVTIEAATTKSNMGYKSVETADIKIVENSAGALGDGNEVEVKLDDTYATDLAFDDVDTDYTIDGEVEIKSFDVDNGIISFKIDSESYSTPSTITITGVAVGTTRSIPYGNYSIIVGGNAIVDNYEADVDTKSTINISEGTPNGLIDPDEEDYDDFEDDGFEFKDYLQIVTDTTTLDGVVEVTIGEKTLKMNGQSYDMDVAAYIQEASDSTMVPLRFVTLALGVDPDSLTDVQNSSKILWDANSKTATILYAAGSQQKIIQFQAGSATMTVDSVPITMENGVVAEIVDSRMFVPFRALGQALGVPVTWHEDTRTAIYNEQLAAADTAVDLEETTEATTAAAEETTEAAAEETTAAAE